MTDDIDDDRPDPDEIDDCDEPDNAVEGGYCCSGCGAEGVKLWRKYSSSYVELRCVDCSEKDEGKRCRLPETDQIGWSVPAVPAGGGAWWGYTSVPDDGVAWWRALPLRRKTDSAPPAVNPSTGFPDFAGAPTFTVGADVGGIEGWTDEDRRD